MNISQTENQNLSAIAESKGAIVGQFSKDLLRFLPKESRYSYEADSLLIKFNAAKPIYEYLYRRSDSWNDPRTISFISDLSRTLWF